MCLYWLFLLGHLFARNSEIASKLLPGHWGESHEAEVTMAVAVTPDLHLADLAIAVAHHRTMAFMALAT